MKKNNQFVNSGLFILGILMLLFNTIFQVPDTLNQVVIIIGIAFLVTGGVSFLGEMIKNHNLIKISSEKYQQEHPDERNRMLLERSSHIMQGINLLISGVGAIIIFILYCQDISITTFSMLIILTLFFIAQIIGPQIIKSIIK